MKKLVLILLFAAATLQGAEVGSPEWIVRSFFEEESFPNTETYYTGEMRSYLTDPNMGSRIPQEVGTAFRILETSLDRIIYAVTYSHEDQEQDWYTFISKEDDTWKLSAVRNLALPGFFYAVLTDLQEKEARTEDEEWNLQNMRLQIASDTQLKNYLKDHEASLKRLVSYFQSDVLLQVKGPDEVVTMDAKALPEGPDVGTLVKDLHLNFAGRSTQDSNTIEISIGGTTDNSVGYLFVPEGSAPPRMNPDEFIYVEEIIPRWYLYKTT